MRVEKQGITETDRIGYITLSTAIDSEELELLRKQAQQALDIERSLPSGARTAQADAGKNTYVHDFIRTRVIHDTLERSGIVPLVKPELQIEGSLDASSISCSLIVMPCPPIGLNSLNPIDLKVERIPKPGVSKQSVQNSDGANAYLDDEKTLRVMLTKRLDADFSEAEMRALGREYQKHFETQLANHGLSPDDFRSSHGLNEEQYAIMMTRHALNEARWNIALDAVFAEKRLNLTENDIRAIFEDEHPGCADSLMKLHELRNDLSQTIEKARRSKAFKWLRENAIA